MRTPGKMLFVSLAAVPLLLNHAAVAQTQAPKSISFSVDVALNRHAIDPNIYGLSGFGLDAGFAKEIALPNFRWGGDGTTRYNWRVDSSNSGKDWYFVGGSGVQTPTPSGQVDAMMDAFHPAGANALITIPIIPFINSTSQHTCSYRQSVYKVQKAYNPYLTLPNNEKCGNGLGPDGKQIVDTDIYYNHIDNSPKIQSEWVKHLVTKYGTAANGPIHYFQLDNEPYGWGNTHVDVMPHGATYADIVALGEQYATAIKDADQSAVILGPSDFTLAGWIGDTAHQDKLFAGQYYLKEFAGFDKRKGSRSLDYFDEHIYADAYDNGGGSPAEIQDTRILWDPTYISGSWIEKWVFHGPMQLLPRFQSWIDQYYPGTKLSISEYSMTHDGKTIYDALTEADTLGIFGRQGIALANLWTIPAPGDPVAFSFRLYRNYDGKGGRFGDEWVDSVSADQTQLAIYGARRTEDSTLTMIVINKTANTIQSPVSIKNFSTRAGRASSYLYSSANLKAIVAQPAIPLVKTGNAVTGLVIQVPAYSATVIAIPGQE